MTHRACPHDSRTRRHDGTVNSEPRRGLFSGLFEAGTVTVDDTAWLQAMLDTEAALARAAERAGLALPGSGAAVTSIASVSFMEKASLGVSAAAAGNPVPALVKAMTGLVPTGAAQAIHLGATSQDIIDTAAMLLARQAIDATLADLAAAAESCAALTREHASHAHVRPHPAPAGRAHHVRAGHGRLASRPGRGAGAASLLPRPPRDPVRRRGRDSRAAR